MEEILTKQILFFGKECLLACDGNCSKAWGINTRPKILYDDDGDEDDYDYLSDEELLVAPIDPGSYEGGHAKPTEKGRKLNKWCARECERAILLDLGEISYLPSFVSRRKNIDPERENPKGKKVSYLEHLTVDNVVIKIGN